MIRAQDIVSEALSWVNTPWQHQQAVKGVGVDCANFLAEVAKATGATSDVEFERNYRRREDGTALLEQLVAYLEPVESLDELRPADVLAFHDGRLTDEPRHVAFISRLTPYLKMAHASERGVRHHRVDAHLRSLIHSAWRIPGLSYD